MSINFNRDLEKKLKVLERSMDQSEDLYSSLTEAGLHTLAEHVASITGDLNFEHLALLEREGPLFEIKKRY